VEFVLLDALGERLYRQLSKGERALMGLSIRVALAKIISDTFATGPSFLILDEVAGNVDEDIRNMLATLTDKVLKNFFSQVFVVSHAEIKDIFSVTMRAEVVNGSSEISVL